jgi:peptidoglycan/LPS O-acetylase OafA/YrhL
VSYSLYLSHLALLLFLINALYPRLGFLQVVLLAVPLALFCATLLCAWVEQPAITISRIVGRRLQQGPPAAVPSGNL